VNPISVATTEKLIMANRKVKMSEIAKELQVLAERIPFSKYKQLTR